MGTSIAGTAIASIKSCAKQLMGLHRNYTIDCVAKVKTRLVRIGNSRGVRIAKPLLEEAGLSDEVEIRARAGAIVITAITRPRAGWSEVGARLAKTKDAQLLDEPAPTRFDEEDWEWG